jgi:hypothetical protein
VIEMKKEKTITIMTYVIIIGVALFLAYMMTVNKTIGFTAREFCIMKARYENKSIDSVSMWDTSCFHPFDGELPMFECRIKCRIG